MRQRNVPLRGESGFSLIELMMASFLLVVGVLATMTMMDGANARIVENRTREAATNLGREIAEAARAVPYPEIADASLETALRAQPGLADGSAADGWQVVRRGTSFTITLDSCIVDDANPRDGLGVHPPGSDFCDTASGTEDVNPDDYRRVTIQVQRIRPGGRRPVTVRQSAVINNPGSAFAPSVRSLSPSSPVLTPPYRVTTTTTTAITFNATVTPRANYVNWFVDNIKQPTAPVRGTADDWAFTWQIPAGVPDGVYLIGAQGFSANDQSGAAKAVTVTLNRFRPTPPANLAGGRNGLFLEFEWSPSPDRDIVGYRVYRVAGSTPATTDPVVCSTTPTDAAPTSCRIADIAGNNNYYVVAVAPACCGAATTAREESQRPTMTNTLRVQMNQPPNPPRNVSGVRTSDRGSDIVTLTWQMPVTPVGGESSDSLRYYRIYRNGVTYGQRYATVAPDQLTFVDTKPGTTTQRYWVVAVDSGMAESMPVGGLDL